MAKPLVVVIGDSGTGKSSSLENLPPERTVIINTENKPLPLKNFSNFKNFMITDWKTLDGILTQLLTDEMAEKYDYVVLDSFSSALEIIHKYCRKVYTGWDIWDNYNVMVMELVFKMKKLKQQCFIIALPEQKAEQFGETKSYARVKGKELKFGYLEKEVAVVLFTNPEYDDDSGEMLNVFMDFVPNKRNSAKAPRGMFKTKPTNDMLEIANKIKEYYNVEK